MPIASASDSSTFANPLNLNYRFSFEQGVPIVGAFREAADPTIVTFNRRYWLFASKSGGYWHSHDLLSWTHVAPRGLPGRVLEAYAPTAVEINGTLYFTAGGARAIFASSNPADGDSWRLVANVSQQYADPMLFVDDDHKVYMIYGCGLAYLEIVQLDPSDHWREVGGSPTRVGSVDRQRHGWEERGENNIPFYRDTVGPLAEGGWLTKRHGLYHLQYAAPGTQFPVYADGAWVSSTSPLGPYAPVPASPFSHRPTGFIRGAGHGSTFRDFSGRWWHATTCGINARHKFERRVCLFPARWATTSSPLGGGGGSSACVRGGGAASSSSSSSASSPPPAAALIADTAYGDYPISVSEQRHPPTWQLLWPSSVVASSFLGASHRPESASDENIRTWWVARSGEAREWLMLRFDSPRTVHALQVNFADEGVRWPPAGGPAAYRYVVEAGVGAPPPDGTTDGARSVASSGSEGSPGGGSGVALLLDRSDSGADAPHEYAEVRPPVAVRWVRLRATAAAPFGGKWSVSGLRLFGSAASMPPPSEVASVVLDRNASDGRHLRVRWSVAARARFYCVHYGERLDAVDAAAAAARPSSALGLHHQYCVYDGAVETHINALTVGVAYTVRVDAINDAGVTRGQRHELPTSGEVPRRRPMDYGVVQSAPRGSRKLSMGSGGGGSGRALVP